MYQGRVGEGPLALVQLLNTLDGSFQITGMRRQDMDKAPGKGNIIMIQRGNKQFGKHRYKEYEN